MIAHSCATGYFDAKRAFFCLVGWALEKEKKKKSLFIDFIISWTLCPQLPSQFLLRRLDLKRKQCMEGQVNSINDGGFPQDGKGNEEEEEEDMDKAV